METIAVYWESTIRTYGFEVRPGVLLARLKVGGAPAQAHAALGVDVAGSDLVMTTGHRRPDGAFALDVAADGALAERLRARAARADDDVIVLAEGDVVYLHGPHYGDRYGIASAALSALHRADMTVRMVSCAGASIFLAVDAGRADDAVTALRTAFVVPDAGGGTP